MRGHLLHAYVAYLGSTEATNMVGMHSRLAEPGAMVGMHGVEGWRSVAWGRSEPSTCSMPATRLHYIQHTDFLGRPDAASSRGWLESLRCSL